MRYDNWDIILFPEDSNIPIPEYKTACYLSRDEDGCELPTLRTHIGSLKPETPFRVSVHHWGPPKLSPFLQQVQRRAGSDITFVVQVIIDGVRLYYGSFAVDASSPQEIAHEQRSFKSVQSAEQPTSHPKHRLRFPRSDRDTMLQSSSWQPRGTDNRIKIILSEQLIDADDTLELDRWDIVCFSFQHAPRELLEQAGIAYPIIDPLRSLMGQRVTSALQPVSRDKATVKTQRSSRVQSENSPEFGFEPTRPANPEPHQQPPTRMSSIAMYPPQFMGHRAGAFPGSWHDSHRPFGGEDISMGSWSSQRYASNTTGVEGLYDSIYPPHAAQHWSHNNAVPPSRTGPHTNDLRRRNDDNAQHFMMAFRDDQFGQILEVISPTKKQRGKPNGLPAQFQKSHQSSNQAHRPPKMGALSVPVRPSSAAITRSDAYSESNIRSRDSIKRPSSDQANLSAKTVVKASSKYMRSKEHQNATETMQNLFVSEPHRCDSDISMRDGSSNISSLSRLERDPTIVGGNIGSAHAPSASGAIRSRKEGLLNDASDDLDTTVHHDHSMLPTLDFESTYCNADVTKSDPYIGPPRANSSVEILDVNAIDPSLVTELTADSANLSSFKPVHKAGMSSISSTGRLERQLYSALGEELGNFEQQSNTVEMGPELAQALSGMTTPRVIPFVNESDPIAKRKRRDTLGSERDSSPTKKKEKAQQASVENADIPDDMPRLRGD